MLKKKEDLTDKEIREEIQKYLYKNPLTSFFSNWGHKKIKDIKKEYLQKTHKTFIETLDICCGLGYNSNYVHSFERYTGLDHNETFIMEARKSFPNHEFIKKDILEKDWELNKKFDIITAVQALEHFSNSDLEIIFDNLTKILRSDGLFIYVIPLDSSFLMLEYSLICSLFLSHFI